MKKKIAIATGAFLVGTGPVHAQSAVTLYGLIDTGLGYVHNASRNQNLVGNLSGNLSGSRWGLKGREDLGAGLTAVFQLENGFNLGTGKLGQGGREFGRQAYVGLSSDRWGTVTLGRQYDPLVDMVQANTGDIYLASIMGTPGDVDNYDNSLRTSNTVKFVSSVLAGLQVEALYGFSNLAGATGQGQTWSGAISYTNGPLALSGGYFYSASPSAGRTASGGSTWNSPSSDSLFDSPINNGYTSAHSIQIARAAGRYTVGAFTAGISYSNVQLAPDGFSAFSRTEKYNVGNVFLKYQMSPAMWLSGGYSYERASGDTSAKYHQFGLGLDYSVSKRTDLFAIAAYQHAIGMQATYATGASGATVRVTQSAQASIGSFGYAGQSTQELVVAGIRHRF